MKRIILLSIDSLRFDALGCEPDVRYLRRYGLEGMRHTPTLDALAAKGVRFRQAISTAPYTTASHASMLTGFYPPHHGVRAFLNNSLSRSVRTIAERLRGVGYLTIGAFDFGELFGLVGLTRGFDYVIKADDRALFELLASSDKQHLFLFVHFGDVHWPYGQSLCPPWESYNDDAYDEEVQLAQELGLSRPLHDELAQDRLRSEIMKYCQTRSIADTVLFPWYLKGVSKFDGGRLRFFLERLRVLNVLDSETLLIVTSDHGEATLPNTKRADQRVPQKFTHSDAVIEELIRVPLVFVGPGFLPVGCTMDAQVSLVDLVPTVLDFVGVRPPKDCDGVTLRGLLEREQDGEPSAAYSEAWYFDAYNESFRNGVLTGHILERRNNTFLFQASLRTPRYKYVETGSDLSHREMSLPDAEFSRAAIRKLLGRVEDSAEVRGVMTALKQGSGREAVVSEFQNRHFHRRALYDLLSDPHEEINLLGRDIASRVFGGPTEYAVIANDLMRQFHGIQGRPEITPIKCSPRSGALERIPPGLDNESGTAMPADSASHTMADSERIVQVRRELRQAIALAAVGEFPRMREQLLHALRQNLWLVQHSWARCYVIQIVHQLAMASDMPIATTQSLCGEIRSALVGVEKERREGVRQMLADVWEGVALPLGMGWGRRADARAAGLAAAFAVLSDPARFRRKELLWLMARGVMGPRVADPIHMAVRRMMRRSA